MKIFISHSWKNKTQAQMIANHLEKNGLEVWIDSDEILPGQDIYDTISHDIKDVGLIVLVWSKAAAKSAGVADELKQAGELKKIVVPFCIDNTSQEKNKTIKNAKGIIVTDMQQGMNQLLLIATHYAMKQFNMDKTESSNAMVRFNGKIEAINHLLTNSKLKQKGTKEEKEFWIETIQDKLEDAKGPINNELKTGEEIMAFMQNIVKELEAAGSDWELNQGILEKVKAFKHFNHPAMQKLNEHIEKIVSSIPQPQKPETYYDEVTSIIVNNYANEINDKIKTSYDQIKKTVGWLIPDVVFKPIFSSIEYYFSSSIYQLDMLYGISQDPNTHPFAKDAINELLNYLSNPDGVISNTNYGLLGYTDDAYLILWVLEMLARKGYINYSEWQINWDMVNAGQNQVFLLFDTSIKDQLNEMINNLFAELENKYSVQPKSDPDDLEQRRAALQRAKDNLFLSQLVQYNNF